MATYKVARLKGGRIMHRVAVLAVSVLAAVSLVRAIGLVRRAADVVDPSTSSVQTPRPVLRAGRALWSTIADAARKADLAHVPEFSIDLAGDPGCQFARVPHPWVFAVAMSPEAIERARWQWHTFLDNVPRTAPDALLRGGRGIVMSGGRLQHLHTAVITITRLRQLGCDLPIELWFLGDEMPGQSLIAYFARLRVAVRCMCDVDGGQGAGVDLGFVHADKRFQIKSMALVMSAFRDILFLDSDNLPAADPTYLFDHVAYRRTGAMFWPDYWACNTHAAYWEILDLHPETSDGRGTFETGQMLVDKARHWQAMMLALEMNLQAGLHYNLGTGGHRCGGGDKETFPAAFDALGHSYHKVGRQPDFLGRFQPGGGFEGTAIVQYDPDMAKVAFLHANTFKFSPDGLLGGERRRWTVDEARKLLGRDDGDLEKECLAIMVDFICSREYAEHAGRAHADKCPALRAALATL
ncbi:unnamed protein product (mitochondrion) [Plasmodiophora brassicae]|uniref:Uncharacterized protein n=2 Tax=Plasmodiophora brassicae TaxID=37360 RepID=A0A3P3YGC2_PLABS|nr:unnamed protein product [Plasmodiophora brassicae]